MLIHNRYIYVELPKTGSSHIARLLKSITGAQQLCKHKPLPAYVLNGNRFVIGSIRHPMDWYVSLWAFGCAKRGGLFRHLTSFPKTIIEPSQRSKTDGPPIGSNAGECPNWAYFYSNVNDPQLFRQWLYAIHDPLNRRWIGENYSASPISLFAGFLSYRCCYLYCKDLVGLYSTQVDTPEKLKAFVTREHLPHFMIRNEYLERDLLTALSCCGLRLNSCQVQQIVNAHPTNASRRKRNPLYYFNGDTQELVRRRDSMVFDMYAYS